MAFTKEVSWNGNIIVSQGQWVTIASISPAVDAKKMIQYKKVYFFVCSMGLKFQQK